MIGIVGVDGSPSCGVTRTLNLSAALDRVGHLPARTARSQDMTALVRDSQVEGRGLVVDCLRKELTRRGDRVPFLAHDLMGELEGKPSTVNVAP